MAVRFLLDHDVFYYSGGAFRVRVVHVHSADGNVGTDLCHYTVLQWRRPESMN